jgi:hypothetical protein
MEVERKKKQKGWTTLTASVKIFKGKKQKGWTRPFQLTL